MRIQNDSLDINEAGVDAGAFGSMNQQGIHSETIIALARVQSLEQEFGDVGFPMRQASDPNGISILHPGRGFAVVSRHADAVQ